jgi:hypothetical protein
MPACITPFAALARECFVELERAAPPLSKD